MQGVCRDRRNGRGWQGLKDMESICKDWRAWKVFIGDGVHEKCWDGMRDGKEKKIFLDNLTNKEIAQMLRVNIH
jgi:hypothetical protein